MPVPSAVIKDFKKQKFQLDASYIRVLAYSKRLTNTMIAKALDLSHHAVSKTLLGQRTNQFKRIKNFVKTYRAKKAA
jgi:hypothetical protein